MSTHVVPFENACKAVVGLLAIHPVVVIVASQFEGAFLLRELFERTRSRRCDLEMMDGRPQPIHRVEGGMVIEVIDPEFGYHGAVTGHARAMCVTNMAQANRLIVHIDPYEMTDTASGISRIEGVATVVVS